MKFAQLFIALYSLVFMTLACSEELPINSLLDKLLQSIKSNRQHLNIPAVGLTLVNKTGTIWSGSFGITNRKTEKKANNKNLFRAGSITKSFTALATHMLVDDSKLLLDEKLSDIAPELTIKNKWHKTHPIRVSHLLEHTASLSDLSQDEFDYNEPLLLEEAIKRGNKNRVTQWPPATHYSYTNVGAGLLAYIIEKRSGQTYEDFVETRIFKPLDMSSASFYPDDKTMRGLATGYNTDGVSPVPYWNMTYRAFGAINLKPFDMSAFLQLLLHKGTYKNKQLLPEPLFERMLLPTTTLAAKNGLEFGYGSGIYSFFRNGHIFYGHGGDGDGYLARYGYNPGSEMAYFVVINVFRGEDLIKIRNLIEDFIITDLPSSAYQSTQLSTAELEEYLGSYAVTIWRFPNAKPDPDKSEIKISLKNGKLYLNQKKRKSLLVPVTKQQFRFQDEPVATMAFVRDQQNKLYLQSSFGNFHKIKQHPEEK